MTSVYVGLAGEAPLRDLTYPETSASTSTPVLLSSSRSLALLRRWRRELLNIAATVFAVDRGLPQRRRRGVRKAH